MSVSHNYIGTFIAHISTTTKKNFSTLLIGLDTDFYDPVLYFPTVTVCPLEPFNIDAINETAIEKVGNHESSAYEPSVMLLKNLTRLSYENLKDFIISKYTSVIKPSETNWNKQSLRKWAFSVVIDVDDVFTQCKFREEFKNCTEIFHPIYSERGFCFSFNSRYYGESE